LLEMALASVNWEEIASHYKNDWQSFAHVGSFMGNAKAILTEGTGYVFCR
jgi:hypothetical protein